MTYFEARAVLWGAFLQTIDRRMASTTVFELPALLVVGILKPIHLNDITCARERMVEPRRGS